MANSKKAILKEINLWKKRFNVSKKVVNNAYKDLSRDARKVYKEITK